MDDRFVNRLGMFRTVKQTLEQPENLAVLQGVQPLAFGVKFDNFKTGLAALETFVTLQSQVITGSAADKRREKRELETVAHELGSALVCWFKSANDQANAAAVDRSMSSWQGLRDEALLQQSQIVIDKAQEFNLQFPDGHFAHYHHRRQSTACHQHAGPPLHFENTTRFDEAEQVQPRD